MIDRQLRKALRATILGLSDAELVYAREEITREQKRRRLQVRERRAKKEVFSKAGPMKFTPPPGADVRFVRIDTGGVRALVQYPDGKGYMVDLPADWGPIPAQPGMSTC